MLCNLDVHQYLAALTMSFSCDYVESIESSVTSIHLFNKVCNDLNYTVFNFSRFTLLEELIIGDRCFSNVNEFVIDGLNELKSLKIGQESFGGSGHESDTSRSFGILNCANLKSIEIGAGSFFGYGGEFELGNLPKLSIIKIGDFISTSNNFFYSSFVVKGIIDMILLMNRSSTFEFY